MCSHVLTYRNGRSECLRCGRTWPDTRGLPHGCYAVNGRALTAGRLRDGYACPICLSDINPRVVLGELRILCAGPEAHDIERLGRAMPKAKRDFIVQQQQTDAADALYGLRGVLEMPILDLQQDAGARLKRAGIIRLGVKKKSQRTGREHPVETPHFVLKDAPGLVEIYGPEPTKLNVWLPFNEVDRNFPAWHQNWVAGGLICRGDSQKIEYAVNPDNGEVIVKKGQALITGTVDGIKLVTGHPVKCPGLAHDLYPRCQNCRPNALLVVMIRELPRLAYYQIATSSKHNVVNLTGQMKWFRENAGRLQGIPFVLERRLDNISTPSGKNGKRVRRDKYLLHLEADPEYVEAVFADMSARALPSTQRMAIPAEVGETPIEVETAPAEVVDLDDDLIWEPPAEDANGNGDEPEEELAELPRFGELRPVIVAQAGAIATKSGTPLAELTADELDEIADWMRSDRYNVENHLNAARAVAVLLADRERVALNVAAWRDAQLPDEIAGKLFEDADHAISALAHSWAVTPDDDPVRLIEWATSYRLSRDTGDSVGDAVAWADKKLFAPDALDEFIAETTAEVVPI